MNLSVNAGNCCDVDNRVVSTPFPGVEQADDPWPYAGFGCIVHIDSLTAKESYDAVQDTGFVVEDIVNKDSNNNPGNEIRQEDDRLCYFFKDFFIDFGNKNCDQYRKKLRSNQV